MHHSPLVKVSPLDVATLESTGAPNEFLMTDQGYAIDFALHNQHRLKFIAEDRRWIAYTGTHWNTACGETLAECFFEELIHDMLLEAAKAEGNKRDRLVERARLAGSARLRKNALALAGAKLAISRDAFDCNAGDLLNTPTGVVNLRTGELAPCEPARMLTQCTTVGYDPSAPFPERFGEIVYALAEDDDETAVWLLRALGYTLTGHTWEDAAFYLRGNGSNGKSTLLKAVASILGTYAHSLDIKFLTAGVDGGHSTEFAALDKKRMVMTTEVERGQKLATSRFKNLTGGDVQAPRDTHQSAKLAAAFAPTLKLWMFGNYDLSVPANDHGTWRRIHKIESKRTFPHSNVRDGLVESEGAGILTLLVNAAGVWYRERLGAQPARVKAATEKYRNAQDVIGRFFADCLEFGEGKHVSKSELTNALTRWLKEGGDDYKPGSKAIAERLREAGAEEGILGSGNARVRSWVGVALKNPADGYTV